MKFNKTGKSAEPDSAPEDAGLRDLSAEDLNRLGDMCLKKGDNRTAIRYFYRSIDKLLPPQANLDIALYKKIIRISSSEERALLALIDIFYTMNLAFEEMKYLELIALYYQNAEQHKKLGDIYKRVLKIDPENSPALKHFQKEKQGLITASAAPQTGDPAEREKTGNVDEGGGGDENRETDSAGKMPDGTAPGHKSKEAAEKTVFPEREKSWKKKIYLFVSVAVVLSVFVVIHFRQEGRFKGVDENTENQQAKVIGSGSFRNKSLRTKDYEVTVEAVPAELYDESGLSGAIERRDLLNNLFYSVTIKTVGGCLPDRLASSPRAMISFIGTKGEPRKSEAVKGLQNLDRVIYKVSVPGCGTNSPVFIKIFLCQKRGVETGGLSIKGADKEHPVIVRW